MSLDRDDTSLEVPCASLDDAVAYFRVGEKPRDAWRVGTEHEKLGVIEDDLAPIPYEGERGIGVLLERVAELDGWQPITEGGHTIALARDGMSITLEPGGQLELSGEPKRTIHETCDEFQTHLALMRRVSEPMGIAWLALGADPFRSVEEAPRMPRVRHELMRRYLPTKGSLALEMMHQTGTVQANFDWADETDMVSKVRAAMAVTPLVSAIYANSSLQDGKASGFMSRRVEIWQHTDPDRCGLLPFVFDDDFGYEAYARWAFGVPLFFIVRDGEYRPAGGLTFGAFVRDGFEGANATLADFERHLTTLFPEVRIKRFMEVRGADAVPPSLTCSLPALWKGLLYDDEARAGALDLAGGWSAAERQALLDDVARRGLAAEAPCGRSVLEPARELVALADAGLRRVGHAGRRDPDESSFLDPVREQLEDGRCPGRVVLEHWEGDWAGSPQRLIEYARY